MKSSGELSVEDFRHSLLPCNLYISRVENEKGLCAYIIYMHIAPFHSQPRYVGGCLNDSRTTLNSVL